MKSNLPTSKSGAQNICSGRKRKRSAMPLDWHEKLSRADCGSLKAREILVTN